MPPVFHRKFSEKETQMFRDLRYVSTKQPGTKIFVGSFCIFRALDSAEFSLPALFHFA